MASTSLRMMPTYLGTTSTCLQIGFTPTMTVPRVNVTRLRIHATVMRYRAITATAIPIPMNNTIDATDNFALLVQFKDVVAGCLALFDGQEPRQRQAVP